jgi:hypothetical protein
MEYEKYPRKYVKLTLIGVRKPSCVKTFSRSNRFVPVNQI